MLSKWGKRALVAVGALFGSFLLLAVVLQVPAIGQTIGSPQACGTCHVMTYEVVTLQNSSHRDLACLDCHSPSGFFAKPVDEIKSASRHMYIFTTNQTPDIIKPTHSSREIIQSRCVECHSAIPGDTHVAQYNDGGLLCFECHREVPHGTPLRH